MKSITKVLLAAALLTGANYSFANAHSHAKLAAHATESQDRHLSGFSAVDVSGSFDVYIVQGSLESVRVEAPSDVMDKIVTEVEDGVLKIHDKSHSGWNMGNWWGSGHKKIAVYVSARELHEIGVTGSGDVSFKNGIHANTLNIQVSGSGDVQGRVEVKSLNCQISGSGDMNLAGHAANSSLNLSGSGDFTGKGLLTENTSVHVSGSGDASINASNSINASVSGSGDVTYSGGARNVVKSKSGSGDISGD